MDEDIKEACNLDAVLTVVDARHITQVGACCVCCVLRVHVLRVCRWVRVHVCSECGAGCSRYEPETGRGKHGGNEGVHMCWAVVKYGKRIAAHLVPRVYG